MSIRNAITCDNPSCNAEKHETNAWFRIVSQYPYLMIVPARETVAPFLPQSEHERVVYDACGEECCGIIVSRVIGVWRTRHAS